MNGQINVEHIFESLRSGLVPEHGLDTFAVGVETPRGELHRQLELLQSGRGQVKFLRGGYGCGKTFMARLAVADARARGFATSFVVVSDNDMKFQNFDDVYRRVMTELGTATCPRGALNDILDRWIARVEDALVNAGQDDLSPDFDQQVQTRIAEELQSMSGGDAPAEFVRVIQTVFRLKQSGEYADAGALLSWLSGSGNVAASAKKAAGVKGEVTSRDAFHYLRGVLGIVQRAGYAGLVIVIDEAETILRQRRDTRGKSLNGIRQIVDGAESYPGLLWLFTGTPEFFDTRHGVAGLEPLHERIQFIERGGFANPKQPQIRLTPFDAQRLRDVAIRLREVYPATHPQRVQSLITDAFIDRLVAEVTRGFRGDVGVVPRQFLRELVTQLDNVDQYAEYDPDAAFGFRVDASALSDAEKAALGSTAVPLPDDGDELMPVEDVW